MRTVQLRSYLASVRWAGALSFLMVVACAAAITAPPAAGLTGVPARSLAGATADWPEFHGSPSLQGYAPGSSLSTADAGQLGLAWASNLYGAALDSPVVAYDAGLGATLAYVGNENGDFYAIDLTDGHIVWSVWLGAPVRGTAAVSGGEVFVVTALTPRVYVLDATTGAVICSRTGSASIESSPVVATPPGGVPTMYLGIEDRSGAGGPLIAMNAATCALEWQFTGYHNVGGPWDPISYAVDAKGEALVLFGTSDPDGGVYALDASTGAEVWSFAVEDPPPGIYDVGAGVTVSPPGAGGAADGVAYVGSKYGVMYALDLTTGAQLWSYVFDSEPAAGQTGISTAALGAGNLVFGTSTGIDDLDPATGTLRWSAPDAAHVEVASSPAIAGPAGSEVALFGDLSGAVTALSLATGAALFSYRTGGYVTASPAVSGGDVLVASSDGFLYDFVVGGGNEGTAPVTAVTSPASGAVLPNPAGDVTVQGTASDGAGVAAVGVAVQSGGRAGSWWDAATGSWVAAPVTNPATLATPRATSTSWSLAFPVPAAGGAFRVVADGVSVTGRPDTKGGGTQFTVAYSTSGPHFEMSSSFAAPGATLTAKGGGFAKGETVAISLDGTTLATATASSTTSAFSGVKVTLPTTAPFGVASLVATGVTSGRAASVPVYVTNSWLEAGGNAARTGYEANDRVLLDLVHPGGNLFVDLAWSALPASSADTAPAVLDGTAYVADAGGELAAIDTANGAVLWTFHAPAGTALSTPAVDPATGTVFAGGADGYLYAVSRAAGTLVWRADVGGILGSGVVGGGDVFVSSANGTVTAVRESDGATAWSAKLGGVPGPPALDAVKQTLVVGDSGSVIALSSTTGAHRWAYAAGARVAPPVVAGGAVYAGSAGASFFALSESSGAKLWSVGLPGRVTAAATTFQRTVLVGASTGAYLLDSVSGSVKVAIPYPAAVIGVAATEGAAVVELTDGLVKAFRSVTGDALWTDQAAASLATAPDIVNGTIYVGTPDGRLEAFTPYGDPPE